MKNGCRMLGANIRKHRCELGLSEMDLAESVGYSFYEIQSLENGILLATYSQIQKIAEKLNTTVVNLLEPLPFDEYKRWVFYNQCEDEFDSLLDYIENIVLTEIGRAEERIERKFNNRKC